MKCVRFEMRQALQIAKGRKARGIALGFVLTILALLGSAREEAVAQTAPCYTVAPVCVLNTGTTSDTTDLTDGYLTYAWYSATASPKTEKLEQCTSARGGATIVIKDAIGTAGSVTSGTVNSIGIIPTMTDTIDGVASVSGAAVLTLNTNHQSVTLQCDGAPFSGTPGNWMSE